MQFFFSSSGRVDTAVWMHYMDANVWRKRLATTTQECLRVILNKSWRQLPAKQQLYGLFPPITKTIKIRRTRHAEHCWRSKDELISDVLLWTSSHGWAKAVRPARTYIQQLCADSGCSLEDLTEAIDDREGWWERVREINADGRHDDDDYYYLSHSLEG